MKEEFKNSTFYLVLVLTLTCLASAFSLALAHKATELKIAEQEKGARLKAIKAVLPPFDNDPVTDSIELATEGEKTTFYIGKEKGEIVGVAFKISTLGYGGTIEAIVGLRPDNILSGIEILKHQETPGLGAKIERERFKKQFSGKMDREVLLTKDEGKIDAITGATISSRAITSSVAEGLNLFQKNKVRLSL